MDWNLNELFIKEHTGVFKAANNYDILNPESGELVMACREPHLGFFTKMLRFSEYKRNTPFRIEINDAEGNLLILVERGISIFLSEVRVSDSAGRHIGSFKQKLFSIGGAFKVRDENMEEICTLTGKWTSWEFKFLAGDVELARVSKKFAGMARELFTSADNYVLTISDDVPIDSDIRKLIVAAVMCIDMVLKE